MYHILCIYDSGVCAYSFKYGGFSMKKHLTSIKKEALLKRAIDLTILKGLYNWSLQDLAVFSGFPLGSIHFLIGSKESLLKRVLHSIPEERKFDSLIKDLSSDDLKLLRITVEKRLADIPDTIKTYSV